MSFGSVRWSAACALLLVGALAVAARPAGPAPATMEPVAVTSTQIPAPPAPMGWASWNSFAAAID